MQSLNSAHDSDVKTGPRRNRWTLWLIVAVCAAPIVASYLAYYVWQPSGHVNYGELLEPRAMPDVALSTIDGRAFRFAELKSEWVLLVADASACDERCRTNLVYMRQVRLAQGKESGRIERVWLVTDNGTPSAELLAALPGLRVVHAGEVLRAVPALAAGRIHLIDPLGNLMMRFPADPDPKRILKDVARLLRQSQWK